MSSPFPMLEVDTLGIPASTTMQPTQAIIGPQNPMGYQALISNPLGPNQFVDMGVTSYPFGGHKEPSYFEDLYFRIHFDPGQINLGNVLSVQTEEIRIWNAYLDDRTITDYVEPVADGVNIAEPVNAPYTMSGLEELSYVVTVSTDGPPQFSEMITWTIDGTIYQVPITGRRVVVFPFGPNWDRPLVESLEWKTDVITAFDGTEDRLPLRSKPRRRISYDCTIHGNDVNHYQNLMFGWQDRQFALPVWQDKQRLTNPLTAGAVSIPAETAGRGFFKGGLVLLTTDPYTFEVVEVLNVNAGSLDAVKPVENNWPVLTRLYPLNLATLPQSVPTLRLTSTVMRANMEWRMDPVATDPYIPAIPATETYGGKEIIYRKPNWASPVQYTSEADFESLDFETGGIDLVPQPSYPRQIRRVQWLLKNRSDVMEFRGMLSRLKGRAISAYVPTWFPDFELAAVAGAGSSALTIKRQQYDAQVGVQDSQRVILLRFRNGTRYVREIIGTSNQGDGTEVLSLNQSIPEEVNTGNVLMISLVHLCRLQQDGVTINYQSDSVATVEINLITANT